MTITGGSALPKEEIDRMMRDAESHAEEDKKRREEAEIRNSGDSLVYQTEKFLKDNEEKLKDGEAASKKSEVESAMADLKKALEGTDSATIKSATEKLAEVSQQPVLPSMQLTLHKHHLKRQRRWCRDAEMLMKPSNAEEVREVARRPNLKRRKP